MYNVKLIFFFLTKIFKQYFISFFYLLCRSNVPKINSQCDRLNFFCLTFNVLTILKLIEYPFKIISLWNVTWKYFNDITRQDRLTVLMYCDDLIWWRLIGYLQNRLFTERPFEFSEMLWRLYSARPKKWSSESVNGVSWRQPVGCLRRTGRIPNCSWTRRRAFRRDNQNIMLIHWTHVLSSRM